MVDSFFAQLRPMPDRHRNNINGTQSKLPLILVHSLSSNRATLAGLIEFLSCFYDVHLIELPGFSRLVPPCEIVSLAAFATFVQEQIEKLHLRTYVLAGISFGFLVVNTCTPTAECKGILAVSPFIGTFTLRRTRPIRLLLRSVISLLLALELEEAVWNSMPFRTLLRISRRRARYECLVEQIDPRTYLTLCRLLLGWDTRPRFHDLPYVLFINRHDRTLKAERVIREFKRGAQRLLVLHHEVEHSPVMLSAQHFSSRIDARDFDRIAEFLQITSATMNQST